MAVTSIFNNWICQTQNRLHIHTRSVHYILQYRAIIVDERKQAAQINLRSSWEIESDRETIEEKKSYTSQIVFFVIKQFIRRLWKTSGNKRNEKSHSRLIEIEFAQLRTQLSINKAYKIIIWQ